MSHEDRGFLGYCVIGLLTTIGIFLWSWHVAPPAETHAEASMTFVRVLCFSILCGALWPVAVLVGTLTGVAYLGGWLFM